ncbi:helix-turn-helix domain-containing protein [Robertmurraya andreesenii]|uniref:Transcriptional regulator with XRE-family HTH domain n=1 Tax=Anoxybacillus andreesenii TaxID=1325932 RepID=A0ABT9V1Z8_9BACL|nr:helix-turn-helix transcriptional regulator [Robertmurraya andreesenii]MDQ0154968.1 transcriptional regulator with XRE-family HTH domain [Robertmurraya andreesenii]
MDITKYIGKAIAHYREQKEWSTVQLAEKSGLSQGSISLYENGKRNPSEEAIEKIANALGVSVKILLERAESFHIQDARLVKDVSGRYLEQEKNPAYDRMRKIERLYHINDLVFELNPDVFITLNAKVYDLLGETEYGRRGLHLRREKTSLITQLVEKSFSEFLDDHRDEIAYRIEENLKKMEVNAYQLIDEMRQNR